jgi:site-specific recombinase XerD
MFAGYPALVLGDNAVGQKRIDRKTWAPLPKEAIRVFSSYIEHLGRRGAPVRTVETYGDCLRRFGGWMMGIGERDPRRLTARQIDGFQLWLAEEISERGRNFSVSYQCTHVAVVRAFYDFMAVERMVLGNSAKGLQFPRQRKKLQRDVLTAGELKQLLAAPDETAQGLRDRAALSLLAMSGPRSSELRGLDLDDVDLESREITIRHGKGGKDRIGFFDLRSREHLARYLLQGRPQLAKSEERAFLVANDGRRLQRQHLLLMVIAQVKRAGIRKHLSCHSLRHTFCTLMLKAGMSLKIIAELAGHNTLATTAKYTRLDIQELTAVYRRAHPLCGGRGT